MNSSSAEGMRAAPFFVANLVASATFQEKSRRSPGEERSGKLPCFGRRGASLTFDGTARASLGQPTR
jgi:hypothetical protein